MYVFIIGRVDTYDRRNINWTVCILRPDTGIKPNELQAPRFTLCTERVKTDGFKIEYVPYVAV